MYITGAFGTAHCSPIILLFFRDNNILLGNKLPTNAAPTRQPPDATRFCRLPLMAAMEEIIISASQNNDAVEWTKFLKDRNNEQKVAETLHSDGVNHSFGSIPLVSD